MAHTIGTHSACVKAKKDPSRLQTLFGSRSCPSSHAELRTYFAQRANTHTQVQDRATSSPHHQQAVEATARPPFPVHHLLLRPSVVWVPALIAPFLHKRVCARSEGGRAARREALLLIGRRGGMMMTCVFWLPAEVGGLLRFGRLTWMYICSGEALSLPPSLDVMGGRLPAMQVRREDCFSAGVRLANIQQRCGFVLVGIGAYVRRPTTTFEVCNYAWRISPT
ncbi:hypothetical protein QBC39DRAFT_89254 [Podospora conica]|nr:hypothetical protein QBC39DRAFT_89254 [Schizothecium conicum]